MIVGRGLIATAFIQSSFNAAGYVVFASGVSNSTETRPEAFAREINLLNEYLSKDKTIIYFSTTSLFDPTKSASPYIEHKRYIESHIAEHASSYVIARLPILLGDTENPHTLINFLMNAILEDQPITLHAHACRHLMDIDDLVPLLEHHAEKNSPHQMLNLPCSEKLPVPALISKMEQILGKRGKYVWEEKGACYDIPEAAGKTVFIDEQGYIDRILKKYLSPRKVK